MNKEFHDVLSELSTPQVDTTGTDSLPLPIDPEPVAAPAQRAEITTEDEQTSEPVAACVSDEERAKAARWLDEIGSQDIEYTDQDLDPEAGPPADRFNEGD